MIPELLQIPAGTASGTRSKVRSIVTGEEIGEVHWLTEQDFPNLMSLAVQGAKANWSLPSWSRAQILQTASALLRDVSEDLATLIVHECGRTIREARDDVRRAADTLLFSGEEARRISGELIDFEAQYRGEGVIGWAGRFPVGVIAGATPFNGPVHQAAHKIGPAFAAGNAILLKPSPKTPLSGNVLANLMLQAGAPEGSVLVAVCPNELVEPLFARPEVDLVSFTGRDDVGWWLRARLPEKRMVLELGANGACIVARDADLEGTAKACVAGAMAGAGQVCASIQRVFVDSTVADRFAEAACAATARLVIGNPLEETTDVGPLFDERAAVRAEELIREAEHGGAKVLCGGEQEGAYIQPCVLDYVTDEMLVACNEAFAPILAILRYETLDEAIERANATHYGLQAAVFTQSIAVAMECYRRLEAGAVMVNRHHAWRVDHMPFGGWKRSGVGKEGVRASMLEFSQVKVLALDWRASGSL